MKEYKIEPIEPIHKGQDQRFYPRNLLYNQKRRKGKNQKYEGLTFREVLREAIKATQP